MKNESENKSSFLPQIVAALAGKILLIVCLNSVFRAMVKMIIANCRTNF